MDAKTKLELLGLDLPDKPTNVEMFRLEDSIKKIVGCSLIDLATVYGLKGSTLRKRINSARKKIDCASGITRRNLYDEFFNLSQPASTVTSQTPTVSASFSEVETQAREDVLKEEVAKQKKLVGQSQQIAEHSQQIAAAAKEALRGEKYQRNLDKGKLERLASAKNRSVEEKAHLESKIGHDAVTKKQYEKQIGQLQAEVERVRKDNDRLVTDNTSMAKAVKFLETTNEQLKKDWEEDAKQKVENINYLQEQIGAMDAPQPAQGELTCIGTTFNDGRVYNTELTACVMKLLDRGVGVQNVTGVIRDVGLLCNTEFSRLPAETTINSMNIRRLSVTHRQLAEQLGGGAEQNTTLMSDETRKRGDTFETFAIRTPQQEDYVLGIRDMGDKRAQTCLDTFKDILCDIEDWVADVGNEILSSIRNTMSDRAATEKKFHQLLEVYKREVMPKVCTNWDDLSEAEQSDLCRINMFYCFLHILVNFAEVSSKVIKQFEDNVNGEDGANPDATSDESGAVKLIRTACKCLARGADEKSGCFVPFRTFLDGKTMGNTKLASLLVPFRGSRFNILFYNAEAVFYLHDFIAEFFTTAHAPANGLQRTVSENIQKTQYLAILKGLGLCSKLVTSPFWRSVEAKGSTLADANNIVSSLCDFLKEAKTDASDVLRGELAPFPDLVEKDDMYHKLLEQQDYDDTTCTVLQRIFDAWEVLLVKAAGDHLPGGKYYNVDQQLVDETASVPRHNKLPERAFGMLDALIRQRPAATSLCNEAHVLFKLNRSGDWMDNLSPDQREECLNASRSLARQLQQKYRGRLQEIEQHRQEAMSEKRRKKGEQEQKKAQTKLDLYNKVLYYGLWQLPKEVLEQLDTITSDAEKKKALKVQLNFRREVLGQGGDKRLFQFSANKRPLSVEELAENLQVLINDSLAMAQHSTAPKSPFVGKDVIHYQVDPVDDVKKPYHGRVISRVPGYPEWHNIKYTDGPALYCYKLAEDYANGDLVIIEGDPEEEGEPGTEDAAASESENSAALEEDVESETEYEHLVKKGDPEEDSQPESEDAALEKDIDIEPPVKKRKS